MELLPVPVVWCELPDPVVWGIDHPQAGTFALVDVRLEPPDLEAVAAAMDDRIVRLVNGRLYAPRPAGWQGHDRATELRAVIAREMTMRTRAALPRQPLALVGASSLSRVDQAEATQNLRRPIVALANGPSPLAGIDDTTPHSARIYDYILGGDTHFEADRVAAEAIMAKSTGIRITARVNRAFMHRSIDVVARLGIDQFVDIGTGIPTRPNLHQIAQGVNPAARIVYVDNDPIVLASAAALLDSTHEGRTYYLEADARDAGAVFDHPRVGEAIDWSKPACVSMLTVLHFLDDDAAATLVAAARERMVPGSYLIISHGTLDIDDGRVAGGVAEYRARGIETYMRSEAQLRGMFLDGLELLAPEVTLVHRWRPAPAVEGTDWFDPIDASVYGVVARVPWAA